MKVKLWISLLISGSLLAGTLTRTPLHSENEGGPFDFDKAWKTADSLKAEGQPRAAAEQASHILEKALLLNNEIQTVKAHLYRIALWSQYMENYEIEALKTTRLLTSRVQGQARPILQMVSARLLYSYYNQHQWEMGRRQATTQKPSDDIREWSPANFADSISALFKASIHEEILLTSIPARNWSAILDTIPGSTDFRPTLFDILAWEALEYFKNEEVIPGRPVSSFPLDHPAMLGTPEDFNQLNIQKMPGESNAKEALNIFQRLSRLHSTKQNTQALVYLTLQRLDYARLVGIMPDKDSLRMATLLTMANTYRGQAASAWILLHLANIADEEENPSKALKYCQEALNVQPHPYVEHQIRTKIEELTKTEISINCEPAIYTSTPALISISWKNTSKAFFRIYTYNENDRINGRSSSDEQLRDFLLKNQPIHAFLIDLPDSGDLKRHTSEWTIPPLDNGFYLIATSPGNSFDPALDQIYTSTIRVSRMNAAIQNQPDGRIRLLVADRKTGQPITQATATLFAISYNYPRRTWERKQLQQTLSDKAGQVFFTPIKGQEWGDFAIQIVKGGDTLTFRNVYPQPDYIPEKRSYLQLQLFSDRAIYRPGQTLYYKGILISKKDNDVQLIRNKSLKIRLINANGQEVASASHKTNAFGSFSGSFMIPATGLNGTYTLMGNEGSLSVSVEDYRRPVFEVTMETPDKQYKTGENAEITGSARAYAGYPITGAKVKYRVTRIEFLPWNYWWIRPIPESEQQVAEGETITDAEGKFSVTFKAIGQKEKYYKYRTEVSVTDINGETRHAMHHLLTGPSSLIISLNLPPKTEINDSRRFALKTTNLEDKPVAATGTIKIFKLRQPEGIESERPLSVPDRPIIPKSLFNKQFPNIVYASEQEFIHWPTESEIKRLSFHTDPSFSLSLADLSISQPGVYKLVFQSTDAFGESVESTQYTVVFDASSSALPYRTECWFTPLTDTAEPGQKARILIGSAYNNIRALIQVCLPGKIIRENWVKLDGGQKNIEIPIVEEYRGNLSFNFLFFAENKIMSRQHIIQVPFSNKKIQIVTESLRQSTEPGAEEKYTFRLLNYKGQLPQAEILAVMYDASLDAFRKAEWNFYPYNSHYGFPTWKPHWQWSMPNVLDFRENEHPIKQTPVFGFDSFNFFGYPTSLIIEERGVFYLARGGMLKANKMAVSEDVANIQESESPITPGQESDEASEKNIPREDFRETALFLPHLEAGPDGKFTIVTRMPDALTRWRLRLLAHDTSIAVGYYETTIETRKPLMVVPNPPRFLHTGDTLEFPAKIVNLTEQPCEVKVSLSPKNALTGQCLTLTRDDTLKTLMLEAGASANVAWTLIAPKQPGIISYRIIATAGQHTDGVETLLPVLSSRKPTISTWPLYIPAGSEKTINTGIKTLQGSQTHLTLEITGNPAWYAVQALPWFDEPQWESAQAWFQTWYVQKLGLHILQQNPAIRKTIETWSKFQPEALRSALLKNKDLKNIDITETPFLNDANAESLRKAKLSQWIDQNHMEDLCRRSLAKLKELQLPNGGFSWFKGMPDSRFITLEIIKGFARLHNYNALNDEDFTQLKPLLTASISYLDQREWEEYQEALRLKQKQGKEEITLSPLSIYWLYVRALWGNEFSLDEKYQPMQQHYLKMAKESWKNLPVAQQGMLAVILVKNDELTTADRIMRSLRDRALHDPVKGMYWASPGRPYWYESGIYTQPLMIEAFTLAGGKPEELEAMKQWLIYNKRTQMWDNNTATLDAIAALMLRGENLLSNITIPKVEVGGQPVSINPTEAGTGYFKTSLTPEAVKDGVDPIKISNPGRSMCWAGIYAQYETDMDQTTSSAGGMTLRKEVFVERQTPQGTQLKPVDEVMLAPGDRLVVRLVLENDQSMEYVHLKDYHASGTEPVDVISGYRWQGGMSFYQSTRDEVTHFFIYFLPEGKHIFEYRLDVFQQGNYTAGFAEIQCQYAPEFSARSASIRLRSGK